MGIFKRKTHIHRAIAAVFTLGLTGCASVAGIHPEQLPPPKSLSMAYIPFTHQQGLSEFLAPEEKPESPKAKALVSQYLENAQVSLSAQLKSVLKQSGEISGDISVIPVAEGLKQLPRYDDHQRLKREEESLLRSLEPASKDPMLLLYGITDYGKTPQAWRSGVVTFEVASTLGIAAFLYTRPATRALAGVYLIQESLEEGLEAYSGFIALDEVYRPVRLSGELIDLDKGEVVWRDSETGFSNRRLSRIYRKVPQSEVDKQLKESLSDATKKLANNLIASFSTTLKPQ